MTDSTESNPNTLISPPVGLKINPAVYIISNRVNNKRYGGQTLCGVAHRFNEHKRDARTRPKTHFHYAIGKHGEEAFHVSGWMELGEGFLQGKTKEEIEKANLEIEKIFIRVAGLTDPAKGYNRTEGGEGGKPTPASIEKMRHAHRGIKPTLEARVNMSKAQKKACQNPERSAKIRSAKTKPRLDFIGRVFGRLTVVASAGLIRGRSCHLCICLCGKEKTVESYQLSSGHTQSCGCLHKEALIQRNKRRAAKQAARAKRVAVRDQKRAERAALKAEKGKRDPHARRHPHSPETRAKIAAALKGRKLAPECSAKIRQGLAEYWKTPEAHHRQSAAQIERFRDPEQQAEAKTRNVGRQRTPEVRANMSAAQKVRFSTPEARQQQSENAKKGWANKSPEQRLADVNAVKLLRKKQLENSTPEQLSLVSRKATATIGLEGLSARAQKDENFKEIL